jgi:hypothetical protein
MLLMLTLLLPSALASVHIAPRVAFSRQRSLRCPSRALLMGQRVENQLNKRGSQHDQRFGHLRREELAQGATAGAGRGR